jgi:hypothetical protein
MGLFFYDKFQPQIIFHQFKWPIRKIKWGIG